MKAWVVYNSVFGNTEKIARAIGAALGNQEEVSVFRAGAQSQEIPAGLESVDRWFADPGLQADQYGARLCKEYSGWGSERRSRGSLRYPHRPGRHQFIHWAVFCGQVRLCRQTDRGRLEEKGRRTGCTARRLPGSRYRRATENWRAGKGCRMGKAGGRQVNTGEDDPLRVTMKSIRDHDRLNPQDSGDL